MKAKFIVVFVLSLATGTSSVPAAPDTTGTATKGSQPQPISVAVLNVAGPRRTLANNIVALLNVNLSSDPRFVLVDRAELNKILDEQVLGRSGNITPDTAATIGHLTGAKILITGREFNDGQSNIVLITNVIGAESGRVYSQTVEGPSANLMALVTALSKKVTETIDGQSANLLAPAAASVQALEAAIEKCQGKPQPSVSIALNATTSGPMSKSSTILSESNDPAEYLKNTPLKNTPLKNGPLATNAASSRTMAQDELSLIFQKAGFAVLDDKARQQPDIIITGDALIASTSQPGGLYSGNATLEIKAVDRASGKILSLDLQQGSAMDAEPLTAMDLALKDATDTLAERLLPTLAH